MGNRIVHEGICVITGDKYKVECDAKGYVEWHRGQLIQVALPTLSVEERETLITGISPKGRKWISPFSYWEGSSEFIEGGTLVDLVDELSHILNPQNTIGFIKQYVRKEDVEKVIGTVMISEVTNELTIWTFVQVWNFKWDGENWQ